MTRLVDWFYDRKRRRVERRYTRNERRARKELFW